MHNNMEESAHLVENFNRKIEADSRKAIICLKIGQRIFQQNAHYFGWGELQFHV